MSEQSNLSVLYKHDYLAEIIERLQSKADIINVSQISKKTGVSRFVLNQFLKGEKPNTSFENIVKLYEFLDQSSL